MNLAKEIEWSCIYPGSLFQEIGAENEKPLYYQCAQFYEQEQEAGQSSVVVDRSRSRDVPKLHQPERNVLQDNLVSIRASTCMS